MDAALVDKYLKFKHHVCRQVYASEGMVTSWAHGRRQVVENQWPEYASSGLMLARPLYMNKRDGPSESREVAGQWWLRQYLHGHVQPLQEHKQHHVHMWDEAKEKYMPLTHCRRKDKPEECKSEFPRLKWLMECGVVLCSGLLRRMGLPTQGRRSRLGALHGPFNEANLNGCHPVMLACQGCNSDVQLP